MATALEPSGDFLKQWYEEFKPQVLKYKRVDLKLVAEIFGHKTVDPVKSMLRNGCPFGMARKEDLEYVYEVYPLRLIEYVEGRL